MIVVSPRVIGSFISEGAEGEEGTEAGREGEPLARHGLDHGRGQGGMGLGEAGSERVADIRHREGDALLAGRSRHEAASGRDFWVRCNHRSDAADPHSVRVLFSSR